METEIMGPAVDNEQDKKWPIAFVHKRIRGLVATRLIDDAAFIGNTGGYYEWVPSNIIDIDVLMFIEDRRERIGQGILTLGVELDEVLRNKGYDFEMRVIRGPYKPTPFHITRPIVFLHLATLTPAEFGSLHRTLKWTWRKYLCVKDTHRLSNAVMGPPTLEDLIAFVQGKINWTKEGHIRLQETLLPNFEVVTRHYFRDDSMFAEYCIAAVAESARIHGRLLGHAAADTLGNESYTKWYMRELLNSGDYEAIMQLKADVRQHGYANVVKTAPVLALRYLEELMRVLTVKYPS